MADLPGLSDELLASHDANVNIEKTDISEQLFYKVYKRTPLFNAILQASPGALPGPKKTIGNKIHQWMQAEDNTNNLITVTNVLTDADEDDHIIVSEEDGRKLHPGMVIQATGYYGAGAASFEAAAETAMILNVDPNRLGATLAKHGSANRRAYGRASDGTQAANAAHSASSQWRIMSAKTEGSTPDVTPIKSATWANNLTQIQGFGIKVADNFMVGNYHGLGSGRERYARQWAHEMDRMAEQLFFATIFGKRGFGTDGSALTHELAGPIIGSGHAPSVRTMSGVIEMLESGRGHFDATGAEWTETDLLNAAGSGAGHLWRTSGDDTIITWAKITEMVRWLLDEGVDLGNMLIWCSRSVSDLFYDWMVGADPFRDTTNMSTFFNNPGSWQALSTIGAEPPVAIRTKDNKVLRFIADTNLMDSQFGIIDMSQITPVALNGRAAKVYTFPAGMFDGQGQWMVYEWSQETGGVGQKHIWCDDAATS